MYCKVFTSVELYGSLCFPHCLYIPEKYDKLYCITVHVTGLAIFLYTALCRTFYTKYINNRKYEKCCQTTEFSLSSKIRFIDKKNTTFT